MFVKICEGSEIFSALKLLACHNLIDAGRRHVTSESETKDFITHSKASDISFMPGSGSLAHGAMQNDPVAVSQLRVTKHREPRSFTMGCRKNRPDICPVKHWLYYSGQ